jgi:hypothetical protein
MTVSLLVDTLTTQGPGSDFSSSTQIRGDKVRHPVTDELLPDWEGFNQILVTGSTQDRKPHALVRKTVPLSREGEEVVAFQLLEAWTGLVEEVNTEMRVFDAQVASENHPGIRESAEFTFDEISQDDLELIRSGAIFYWSIGYQIDKFGRRSTQSSLRFKRGKFWTRKEKEQAEKNPVIDLQWLRSDDAT